MTPAQIKDLYDRKAAALARRPPLGRNAGQARLRLLDGLTCQTDHGDRSFPVDLGPADGGDGRAPHPGQLMRASVGACLAMGYRIWAARLDVALDGVELEVTCEFDARGQLGVDAAVPVGWQTLHIAVTLVSAAPEADLRHLFAHVQHLSPMLANLAPHIRQSFELTIVRPFAAASTVAAAVAGKSSAT
jgi:uncharacterized OsmC-like protein